MKGNDERSGINQALVGRWKSFNSIIILTIVVSFFIYLSLSGNCWSFMCQIREKDLLSLMKTGRNNFSSNCGGISFFHFPLSSYALSRNKK